VSAMGSIGFRWELVRQLRPQVFDQLAHRLGDGFDVFEVENFLVDAFNLGHSLPEPGRPMKGLGRIERTDGDIISVRISERKLLSSSAGIHIWLFFQPADERARPWQSYVKVVDPEEQEEAVARLGVVGTCQRGSSPVMRRVRPKAHRAG
jgi:hypothetical protein